VSSECDDSRLDICGRQLPDLEPEFNWEVRKGGEGCVGFDALVYFICHDVGLCNVY